jgi:tRNA1Val (adenine37-N6)-methyltransferase
LPEARKAAVFHFKQFSVRHDRSAMKVGTDGTVLGALVECNTANRILDIGAGTGVVSLMLAQRCMAAIVAIELDELSFLDLQENCQNSVFHTRIAPLNRRIQDYQSAERFDLIVSNPPYFNPHTQAQMRQQRRLARHDGDLPTRDLITAVCGLLSTEGLFWLILPTEAMANFKKLAIEKGLNLQRCIEVCHTKNVSPVREIAVFAFKKENSPAYSKITLRNKDDSFSDDYRHFMNDYLLVL